MNVQKPNCQICDCIKCDSCGMNPYLHSNCSSCGRNFSNPCNMCCPDAWVVMNQKRALGLSVMDTSLLFLPLIEICMIILLAGVGLPSFPGFMILFGILVYKWVKFNNNSYNTTIPLYSPILKSYIGVDIVITNTKLDLNRFMGLKGIERLLGMIGYYEGSGKRISSRRIDKTSIYDSNEDSESNSDPNSVELHESSNDLSVESHEDLYEDLNSNILLKPLKSSDKSVLLTDTIMAYPF